MPRLARLSVIAAATALVCAAPAAADTSLGSATQPSGSTPNLCTDPAVVVFQYTDNPASPYVVPAAGRITSWQTNTNGAVVGSPLTLVVLKRVTATSWSVAGTDSQTLPTPLPASNVASFTVATPIPVSGGETLGLYGSAGTICYFHGGSVPLASSLDVVGAASPPAAGQTLFETSPGPSPGGYTMNLAAILGSPAPAAPVTPVKKKCKKKKKKRHAAAAKKKHCKKKKKK